MATRKVNFNQQLASEAVDALTALSAHLRKFQQMEAPLRTTALGSWNGPDADQFRYSNSKGVPWIQGQAGNLITAIGATVQAIEQGSEAARTQNAKSSG